MNCMHFHLLLCNEWILPIASCASSPRHHMSGQLGAIDLKPHISITILISLASIVRGIWCDAAAPSANDIRDIVLAILCELLGVLMTCQDKINAILAVNVCNARIH